MSRAVPVETPVVHPLAVGASTGSTRLKILLVEDDEADAYLIRRASESNENVAEVVLAQDGVEAIELVERGVLKPDLAFVDLHMPRKDGFALLRDLAVDDSSPFPVVVLTSSRSGADVLRSMKRGAALFVTKPRTQEEIAAALDRAIDIIYPIVTNVSRAKTSSRWFRSKMSRN